MALRMLMAFTYLPGFVTLVLRGMPTVWRGRHRLIFCWLVCMQAVTPGRHTWAEMARWTPAAITAWRFGRLLKAAYRNIHRSVGAYRPAPTPGCCSGLWRYLPGWQVFRRCSVLMRGVNSLVVGRYAIARGKAR